jgi:hypothetical protein
MALSTACRKPQLQMSIVCDLQASHVCELEVHRRLIRTRLSAGVADLVCIRAMATITDGIGLETVVRRVDEQRATAANIDGNRSRPAPREVHSVASALGSQTQ